MYPPEKRSPTREPTGGIEAEPVKTAHEATTSQFPCFINDYGTFRTRTDVENNPDVDEDDCDWSTEVGDTCGEYEVDTFNLEQSCDGFPSGGKQETSLVEICPMRDAIHVLVGTTTGIDTEYSVFRVYFPFYHDESSRLR